MTNQRDEGPAATGRPGKPPSAGLVSRLRELLSEGDKERRGQAAWRLVLQAAGNEDFPVVLDFAFENDLIASCEVAGKPARHTTWVNPIDGSEMVWIPPGPFYVGEDKQPAESKGFSLARFPVTNAQFARFLDESGPPDQPWEKHFLAHWTNGVPRGREDHPVVWVSYLDALHYCAWAGLTLPTEWLWEKAARGPDGRPYPWGVEPPSGSLTNVRSSDTYPVGHFARTRTPYGCEDLVGNVSEWCQMTEGDDFGYFPETCGWSAGTGGACPSSAATAGSGSARPCSSPSARPCSSLKPFTTRAEGDKRIGAYC
jgi:formylglycine-generating enzyme required for sulfatase activity